MARVSGLVNTPVGDAPSVSLEGGVAHYSRGRRYSMLGPGVPDPPDGLAKGANPGIPASARGGSCCALKLCAKLKFRVV